MKKFLMLVLVFVMLVASACTAKPTATEVAKTEAPAVVATEAPTEPPAPAAKEIIAVCLPALDNPLMLAIQDTFKNGFGAEYDVQVASADGNAVNQATQVENFTAMKVKLMVVMAVEATSLVPKLIAARQAGIIVMVIGGDPGDPECLRQRHDDEPVPVRVCTKLIWPNNGSMQPSRMLLMVQSKRSSLNPP